MPLSSLRVHYKPGARENSWLKMTSLITRTFFVLFVGFIIVIRCSLVEIHRYSRIASLDNKIIADQQPALFTGKLTIVDCVIRCALTQHCVSVFYLSSSCKGYPTVFSSTSPGLTTLTGAQYFVSETANLTSEVIYEATMHKYWEYPGYINVVGHF